MSRNKFIYIGDFFLSDIIGGGELNDHELCEILLAKKIRSHEITIDFLDAHQEHKLIVSNFINLPESVKEYMMKKRDYIIYEHDHKYLKTRNPAEYTNFKAPSNELINVDFYKKSLGVFCQSSFHEDVVKRNIDLNNTFNVSGNLWSIDSLEFMKHHCHNKKTGKYSILDSNIPHKNTYETMLYCNKKGFEYDLISSQDYLSFLTLLSKNDKFIFLPKTPETLSRVVVEARMLGIKTITNKNVGAAYEDWFALKGEDLIDHMIQKRKEIPRMITERFQ